MDQAKLKAAIDKIAAKVKADAPTFVPILEHVLEALQAVATDPVAKAVIAANIAVLEALVPNPQPPAAK